MTEKSLEEQANELLEESARREGKRVRDFGVLNRHRWRRINDVEIPMSEVWPNSLPWAARPDTDDPEDE